ncbi:MAG TPA: hypothetical protein ENJ30_14150 [Desulfobulbaceae bacterium]|nr:hypothetical protein [Desulfobulbaceae bacterium]
MNELLEAVRKALSEGMPEIRDVFIATDEQVLPAGARLPCIGIKDGTIKTRKLTCGVTEKTLQLSIIAWSPQGKDAAQVTGDPTQPGVVQMIRDIEDVLDENMLSIVGMTYAGPVEEAESRLFINKQNKTIQQKIIIFEYERER